MRKITVFILTFSFYGAFAQTDSLKEKKPKHFIAAVSTVAGEKDKGLIYELQDSSITLKTMHGIKSNFISRKKRSEYVFNSYARENIEAITIKRSNAKTRGLVIGAGVGLALGIIMGLADGDDPVYEAPADDFLGIGTFAVELNNAFALTAGQKALILGTAGASAGSLVGLLVGALAKKKFIINGDRQKFEAMKLSVLERTYSK